MRWLIRLLRRTRAPFRRDELLLDINEEFRAHIEFETEERIRAGMNAQEARRTALRDFGGIDRYVEEARSVRGAPWLDFLNDLRHSLRVLRREKAFTATVLITLAVCVGVNAAIFSVVNAVLLAPLPFSEPDRLVAIWNSYPGAGVPRAPNAPADYFVRRERTELFESLAQFLDWPETVGEAGGSERVVGMRVTPSFFPMLGVRPRLGRGFHEEEMVPGNERVVILTHGYWQDMLGGDPGVLDNDLRIAGRPYRIVGILPRSFRLPRNEQPQFFVPLLYPPEVRGPEQLHSNQNFEMWGRLRPGVSIDRARAENEALNAALVAESPIPNAAELLEDAGYRIICPHGHSCPCA